MSTYNPYDMLQEGGNQLPALRQDLEQRRIAEGRLNQEVLLDQDGFTAQNPQDAMAMRRAGMFEQQDGTFIDPYRLVAQERRSRIDLAQERNEEQKQAIADSVLFKFGDTLADTGRMFLSPLFWLKGEDTTKYDPSARLKTGYRNQFESLEDLRNQNVTKFLESRNQRLAAAGAIKDQALSRDLTYAGQQNSLVSPFEKELLSFANGNGPEAMALYNSNDPAKRKMLADMVHLENGKSIQYGDRIVKKDTHTMVLGRAKDFRTEIQGYVDALSSYSNLVSALEAGDGFGDLAAIFGFMKMLDPRSVVRDSEFQAAAGAEGVFNRLMNIGDEMMNGNKLTDTGRQAMAKLSAELVRGYQEGYAAKRLARSSEFSRYQYKDDEINEMLGGSPVVEIREFGEVTPFPVAVRIDAETQDPDELAFIKAMTEPLNLLEDRQ